MTIRSFLTSPSRPGHPVYVYGFLVFLLLALAWIIRCSLYLPPSFSYGRHGGIVVVLMVLFNHLAFQFRWPGAVTAALRVLAVGGAVFGLFYVLYWLLVFSPA